MKESHVAGLEESFLVVCQPVRPYKAHTGRAGQPRLLMSTLRLCWVETRADQAGWGGILATERPTRA